jgi:hypothetical protein
VADQEFRLVGVKEGGLPYFILENQKPAKMKNPPI